MTENDARTPTSAAPRAVALARIPRDSPREPLPNCPAKSPFDQAGPTVVMAWLGPAVDVYLWDGRENHR